MRLQNRRFQKADLQQVLLRICPEKNLFHQPCIYTDGQKESELQFQPVYEKELLLLQMNLFLEQNIQINVKQSKEEKSIIPKTKYFYFS